MREKLAVIVALATCVGVYFYVNTALDSAQNPSQIGPARTVPQKQIASLGQPMSENPLDIKERELTRLDFRQHRFKPLKAGNTTKTAWKVKNKQGKTVALLKCSQGNTFHKGEIASYKLGRYLDFNIYPVTVARKVNKKLARRLKIRPQECALKEWVSFWSEYYWKADSKKKNTFISSKEPNRRRLARILTCRERVKEKNQPEFLFRSYTRSGHPSLSKKKPTRFVGSTNVLQVAKDFSNMMVMDAILDNADRFPGGNLMFRSEKQKNKQKGKVQMLIAPRLFSLDNGASLKGWKKDGKQIGLWEMKRHLRRFDKRFIAKIKKLKKKLLNMDNKKNHRELAFLDFSLEKKPNISVRKHLIQNINEVLSFVAKVEKGKVKTVMARNRSCRDPYL